MHDLVSFTLNSSLSMAVIIFLLPSKLALGYVVSFVLCLGFIFLLRKTIAASSSDYEIRYLAYTDTLNKAWDNVALGNSYNEAIWRRRKEEAGRNFYKAAIALQIRKQLGNILLAGASLLPTIFLIVMIFRDGHASPPVVAAVVVNLTRIFLILNALSALVYKVLDLSSMRAKLEVLFAPVTAPSATPQPAWTTSARSMSMAPRYKAGHRSSITFPTLKTGVSGSPDRTEAENPAPCWR
ncbi:hypothetical protein ACFSUI_21430 [Ralstonia solanacearum]